MKKRIHCIIQARFTSSRLPGKVFLSGPEKSLLDHLIDRLKNSKYINKIILATPNSKINLFIKDFIKNRIKVFQGNEKNVLERYYLCAKKT